MPISIFHCVKILGLFSEWTLKHSEIQELLYISNVFHIGIHNKPLSYEGWFAFKNGPVCLMLYQELMQFKNRTVVEDIFIYVKMHDDLFKTKEYDTIRAIYYGEPYRGISQRAGGAWDLTYNTQNQKFKYIFDEYIKQEYNQFYNLEK